MSIASKGTGSIVLGLGGIHRFVFIGSGLGFGSGGPVTIFHNGVGSGPGQVRFFRGCFNIPNFSLNRAGGSETGRR